MILSSLALTLGLSALAAAAPTRSNNTLSATDFPTIDLGYAIHKATSYNESYDSYTFSNIRFAAPPTGSLRFAAPQAPLQNRTAVQDGSIGGTCPQGQPAYTGSDLTQNGEVSEDCLFLDVIVPRKVLEGGHTDVPVLVWIFGGGYVLGSKTQQGDPINFLVESPSPVIYVAPNYRLGAFGWLGGPSFTLSDNTAPNAGLYDQRFALKWVQDNIHLFGGSKDDVTVMGGSAGAGSIMHQISAYGGKGEKLFKRAIPIGPGFSPVGGHSAAETSYLALQDATNCTDQGIECLRAVPTEQLQLVNEQVITAISPPRTGFGPSVDGDLVPDIPAYLYAQGRIQKDVEILVMDDINEGASFVGNDTTVSSAHITSIFPGISNASIAELLALYPPPSASTPYKTEHERLIKVTADSGFDCNRYSMSAALPDSTYNLVSTIPPGTHGTWSGLLFNEVPGAEAVVDRDILLATRRFVMNFVVGGTPNELPGGNGTGVGPEHVMWPTFGSEGKGLVVSGTNMTVVDASGDKEVCEWWAKGLYLS
ncbi:acetylcholinesterase precursor [Morchella snyderi]|nr:acetylcholinesterase precursor [Morchella snyderi]